MGRSPQRTFTFSPSRVKGRSAHTRRRQASRAGLVAWLEPCRSACHRRLLRGLRAQTQAWPKHGRLREDFHRAVLYPPRPLLCLFSPTRLLSLNFLGAEAGGGRLGQLIAGSACTRKRRQAARVGASGRRPGCGGAATVCVFALCSVRFTRSVARRGVAGRSALRTGPRVRRTATPERGQARPRRAPKSRLSSRHSSPVGGAAAGASRGQPAQAPVITPHPAPELYEAARLGVHPQSFREETVYQFSQGKSDDSTCPRCALTR